MPPLAGPQRSGVPARAAGARRVPARGAPARAAGHAAPCPEALAAAWSARVAVAERQQQAAGRDGGPAPGAARVRARVVRTPQGLLGRIRHVRPADQLAVADLQAAAFHEALPVAPFDQLAYNMFRAEVLDAVKKKLSVLDTQGFVMLVAEACDPASDALAACAAAAASCSDSDADGSASDCEWDSDAVWYGDQQAAPGPAGVAGVSSGDGSSSDGGAALGRILGVVEVGVQDEADVLQHLPPGSAQTYAYISSMAVAPALRRCGIGAALLQAAEQQAVLWQQPLVALHVHTTNQRAVRLYQRCGMVATATDPAWRRLLGGKVRQLMVKRL